MSLKEQFQLPEIRKIAFKTNHFMEIVTVPSSANPDGLGEVEEEINLNPTNPKNPTDPI